MVTITNRNPHCTKYQRDNKYHGRYYYTSRACGVIRIGNVGGKQPINRWNGEDKYYQAYHQCQNIVMVGDIHLKCGHKIFHQKIPGSLKIHVDARCPLAELNTVDIDGEPVSQESGFNRHPQSHDAHANWYYDYGAAHHNY